MYLIITLLLIALVVFIIVFPKFNVFREKYKMLITFIFTLVATFSGVFIAIDFNNKEVIRKEKGNVVKILQISKHKLTLHQQKAMKVRNYVEKYETKKDTAIDKEFEDYLYNYIIGNSTKNDKPISFSDAKNEDKNRYSIMLVPDFFNQIVNNEYVMRNISLKGVEVYYEYSNSLIDQYNECERKKTKGSNAYLKALNTYIELLENINKVFAIETNYLDEEISQKKAEKEYSKINHFMNETELLLKYNNLIEQVYRNIKDSVLYKHDSSYKIKTKEHR